MRENGGSDSGISTGSGEVVAFWIFICSDSHWDFLLEMSCERKKDVKKWLEVLVWKIGKMELISHNVNLGPIEWSDRHLLEI